MNGIPYAPHNLATAETDPYSRRRFTYDLSIWFLYNMYKPRNY